MRPLPPLLLLVLIAPGVVLVPAVAQDTSSSDLVQSPPSPTQGTVWTVLTTVEAVVRDNYATVQVIADIGNRGPDPEFPFRVPVPDDAFVTGLTITRDGEVYEARIEDRTVARQEYDAHKAQQQTGGLVEKQRGSSVYSFLVNVAEFTSVRAVLTYERYLAAEEGTYHLPLVAPVSGFGEDLGARFAVRIAHADGVPNAWGSVGDVRRDQSGVWHLEHRVGPRGGDEGTSFEAHYELAPTPPGGSLAVTVQNGTGYFAHRFRAPPDARQLPLDLVLVLDVSGSMSGLKVQQMKDAAAQVVALLRPEDRLHLVFFSSDAYSPWSGLRNATTAHRTVAADELGGLVVAGGTNIEAGIRRGFDAFAGVDWSAEEGRMPLLVFLTDGQPTSGLTDKARLREEAKEANAHGVPVFALAFGNDADWGLVAGLAADGNGVALRVPEGAGAEVDLRRFLAALTTPVLRNVTLHYQGATEAHHRAAPILFAGSELLVVGTFDPSIAALRGQVRATAPDGARTYDVNLPVASAPEASFLPRLFAYEEIRRLQDVVAADGAPPAAVGRIRDLALRHGFVTDYTSLVVTLDPRATRGCEDCDAVTGRNTSQSAPSSPTAGKTGTGAGTAGTAAPSAQSTSSSGGTAGAYNVRGTPDASDAGTAPGPAGEQRTTLNLQGDGAGSEEELQRKDASTAAATPGFEALAAVAAVGVALVALRRRK